MSPGDIDRTLLLASGFEDTPAARTYLAQAVAQWLQKAIIAPGGESRSRDFAVTVARAILERNDAKARLILVDLEKQAADDTAMWMRIAEAERQAAGRAEKQDAMPGTPARP